MKLKLALEWFINPDHLPFIVGLDKGLYKSNGEFAVTSDGARILNDLLIKNPGAKLLVSLGKAQEAAIGDGVTSTVLLAGALLDEAGGLIRKGVHPMTVVDGFVEMPKEKDLEFMKKN